MLAVAVDNNRYDRLSGANKVLACMQTKNKSVENHQGEHLDRVGDSPTESSLVVDLGA